MSSGMPELGSKISLISKADIRYEGRLFTVDPQECTIALASVRSFGTEDRETQFPVAPQSQVYDYILFRGSDIKDIRVLNNVPSLPNDPAIMQMSVPPSLGGVGGAGAAPGQFPGQFSHPVVGQPQYPQYHPMGGFPGGVHTQLGKTSSMLDLIGGGSQQNASRSNTPAVGSHRKSPTADQGTQVGNIASGSGSGSGQQREPRRGSTGAGGAGGAPGKPQPQPRTQRANSRNRQRYPSGGSHPHPHPANQQHHQQQHQQQQHHQQQQQQQQHHHHHHQQQQQHHPPPQGQPLQQAPQHHHHQPGANFNVNNSGSGGGGYGRGGGGGGGGGGWRGRARGRGRGYVPRNKNTLKFDNDYDFEQANTEFEELRSQLAKTKITDEPVKVEEVVVVGVAPVGVGVGVGAGEADKKDDSGNETGAGEAELDDDQYTGYDKTKSFFDNISCEAVERSKGKSQRTDWRVERKLNSETFGVASARRGAWRGRATWRHNPHHQQMSYFPSWRAMRGGRGRPNNVHAHINPARINQPRNAAPPAPPAPSAPLPAPAPLAAAAK